jgi:hypothetical protein
MKHGGQSAAKKKAEKKTDCQANDSRQNSE